MGNVLAIISAVTSLFPTILTFIQGLETAFAGVNGAGAQKLAILETTLKTTFASLTNVSVSFEQVWPTISAMVSTLVAAFNVLGIFKSGTAVVSVTSGTSGAAASGA